MMDNVGNYSEVEEDTTPTPPRRPNLNPYATKKHLYRHLPTDATNLRGKKPPRRTPHPRACNHPGRCPARQTRSTTRKPPSTCNHPEPVEQEPEEPPSPQKNLPMRETLVSEPEPAPEAVLQETPAPTYGYGEPVEEETAEEGPSPPSLHPPRQPAPLHPSTPTITLIPQNRQSQSENLPSSAVESLQHHARKPHRYWCRRSILSIITNLEGTQAAPRTVKELANVGTRRNLCRS